MELQDNREKALNHLTFEFATSEDETLVRELLIASKLPHEDIAPHLPHFILAKDGNDLIGCVGLEITGEDALLRSLAVSAPYRSRGLGKQLCDRLEEYARSRNLSTIYLMTITRADYFAKRGYQKVDRASTPQTIRSTRQFSELCPSSAVTMKIEL
jgi:amino-acid N-acetyltransferase